MKTIHNLSLLSLVSVGVALAVEGQTVIDWTPAGTNTNWSTAENWQNGNIPDTNGEAVRNTLADATEFNVDLDYTINNFLDGFSGPDVTTTVSGTGLLTIDRNRTTTAVGIDNATGTTGGTLRFTGSVKIANSQGGTTTIRNANSSGNTLVFATGGRLTIDSLLETQNGAGGSIQFNGTLAASAANLRINSTNVSFGPGHDSSAFGADLVLINNSILTINGGTVLNTGRKFQVNGTSQLILNSADAINFANITVSGSNAFTLDVNASQANMGLLTAPGALTIDLDPSVNVLAFLDSSALDWGTGTVSINGFQENVIRFGTDGNGLTPSQLSAIDGGAYFLSNDGYLTAVPEPATFALLFGALALGLCVLRRKQD